MSSFVNTTTAFFSSLLFRYFVFESIGLISYWRECILGITFIFVFSLVKKKKRGDLLLPIWFHPRLNVLLTIRFDFRVKVFFFSMYTNFSSVRDLFFFDQPWYLFLLLFLDNDISILIRTITNQWIIFSLIRMIWGKKTTHIDLNSERYLHLMSKGISSILCIHKSRHRWSSVV